MFTNEAQKTGNFRPLSDVETYLVSGGHFHEDPLPGGGGSQDGPNFGYGIDAMLSEAGIYYYDVHDGGERFGGDGREGVFKATVKALIPGDPITKEIVASAVTELRNFLIDATSLENKQAAADFLDQVAPELVQYLFGDALGQGTPGQNPVEAFNSMFGTPNVPNPGSGDPF